ncbi:MAG: hypothetical protein V1914_03475 [archaeon]
MKIEFHVPTLEEALEKILSPDKIVGVEEKIALKHPDYVCGVGFSPCGGYLATGCSGGLRVFDFSDRKSLKKVLAEEHPGWVRGVGFSPCGGYLATGCDDGNLRVFEVKKE